MQNLSVHDYNTLLKHNQVQRSSTKKSSMKKILLTAITIASAVAVNAQFTYNYLRAADNYYNKGDYYSAAVYYEKFLGQGNNKKTMPEYDPYTTQTIKKKTSTGSNIKEDAIYHLAECYRLLHYPAKAEPYYKEATAFNKQQYPLANYWYGTTERALAKYDEADKAFNSFLDEYKKEDGYTEDAKREILDLHFIQAELKKDISHYIISETKDLNDSGANYAPVWLNNNTLLFTSTRPTDSTAAKKYINHIYAAVYDGSTVNNVTKVNVPQIKDEHQGVVSATPDGKTIFLTRWTLADGKKIASIYTSTKNDSGWSAPVAMDSIINTAGFSSQQPFVMPDGKHLLYASNKAGGSGGFDLWYATLDADGKAISTANLGTTINTVNDEQAPYYHATSNTLVFATNGRVGMGGFDLFYTKGNIDNWSAPVNFGYPVNSVKDDIYFASKGNAKNILKDAMLSSDRASACCLDLFNVQKQLPLKKLSGIVVLCDNNMPFANATVNIVDTLSGKIVATKTTGNDGSYSLLMEDYQPLKVVAASTGYHADSLHFEAPANDESITVINNPNLCLSKISTPTFSIPEVGKTMVLSNVYFALDKSVPLPTSYPTLDTLVETLKENPTVVIEIGGHTDSLASVSYNQKLSQARAENVVKYLVSKGIAQERLTAKGYGESMPIAPNSKPDGTDNPEGRQMNRRTEFKVIKK
jgi:outer membrane protein OmpA-like peptidoglycan-associated protein